MPHRIEDKADDNTGQSSVGPFDSNSSQAAISSDPPAHRTHSFRESAAQRRATRDEYRATINDSNDAS